MTEAVRSPLGQIKTDVMKRYYKENNGVKEWFSGAIVKEGMQIINPTPEMLSEDGWIEYVPPVSTHSEEDVIRLEVEQLKQELTDTDYIAIKAFEGEDVSKYGDWKGRRHAIRERINELEQSIHPQEEEIN